MNLHPLDLAMPSEAQQAFELMAPELAPVPSGAFALAGVAVGLLLLAWLLIYFGVFLPRGPVG
jgi:hypothetical protein